MKPARYRRLFGPPIPGDQAGVSQPAAPGTGRVAPHRGDGVGA